MTLVFEKSSHRVSAPADPVRRDRGVAERLVERESPVSGKRDLRARVAALCDVRLDEAAQPGERRLVKAQLPRARRLERESLRGTASGTGKVCGIVHVFLP